MEIKRRNFLNTLGTGALAASASIPLLSAKAELSSAPIKTGEIRHMVIFDLIHEKGKADAEKFLKDGQSILTKIPGVQDFQVLDQVSLKNDYTYGFSMLFSSQATFEAYTKHPDHIGFVENRWEKEVKRFLEIDFKVH
jgi:heme-degrading monooxygenase HmoA